MFTAGVGAIRVERILYEAYDTDARTARTTTSARYVKLKVSIPRPTSSTKSVSQLRPLRLDRCNLCGILEIRIIKGSWIRAR
jgi:hypothetical protein